MPAPSRNLCQDAGNSVPTRGLQPVPLEPILRDARSLNFSHYGGHDMAVHQSVCPQPQLPPGEHLVAVNGVKLHCIVSGRGPLLVVQAPGWGIGSTYLRNGLAPVEDQFTLLFYDPRGSGKSTRPTSETQMSTSDMVEDLEQMRRYWGLKSINVLGHSNGGSIALGYAERYPDHLEKLIVVNSCLPGFDASATVRQFINRRKDDIRY